METYTDEIGEYTIITEENIWHHNCHPETCGCGNKGEVVVIKYKKYKTGEIIVV